MVTSIPATSHPSTQTQTVSRHPSSPKFSSSDTVKAGNLSSTPTTKTQGQKPQTTERMLRRKVSTTSQASTSQASTSQDSTSRTASQKHSPLGMLGFMVGGVVGATAGAVYSLPRNLVRVANGKEIKSIPEHMASVAKIGAEFLGNIGNKAHRPDKIISSFTKFVTSKFQSKNTSESKLTHKIDHQISNLKNQILSNNQKLDTLTDQLDLDGANNEAVHESIAKLMQSNEDLSNQIKSLEYIKSNPLDDPKETEESPVLYATQFGPVHKELASNIVYASEDGKFYDAPAKTEVKTDMFNGVLYGTEYGATQTELSEISYIAKDDGTVEKKS